jgi:hypothetical protein
VTKPWLKPQAIVFWVWTTLFDMLSIVKNIVVSMLQNSSSHRWKLLVIKNSHQVCFFFHPQGLIPQLYLEYPIKFSRLKCLICDNLNSHLWVLILSIIEATEIGLMVRGLSSILEVISSIFSFVVNNFFFFINYCNFIWKIWIEIIFGCAWNFSLEISFASCFKITKINLNVVYDV